MTVKKLNKLHNIIKLLNNKKIQLTEMPTVLVTNRYKIQVNTLNMIAKLDLLYYYRNASDKFIRK